MLRNEFDNIDLIIPTLERQTASLVGDETIIQIDIDAAWLKIGLGYVSKIVQCTNLYKKLDHA